MKSDNPAPNQAVRRWPDLALISLFALFLLLPLLDLAFHLDPSAPPSENRLPAALPHRPDGFAGLKKFFADWEIYFNDHFGFRKTLVNWHNRFKWSFFKEQNANNVLVGTGGWIYMAERRMIEHFRGTLSRNDISLTRAVGALTGNGEVLKADDDGLTFNIGTLTFDVGGLTFDVFGHKHVDNSLFDSTFRKKTTKTHLKDQNYGLSHTDTRTDTRTQGQTPARHHQPRASGRAEKFPRRGQGRPRPGQHRRPRQRGI